MISKNDFIEKKIILAFTIDGDTISFSNSNIIIKDKDNKIKLQYTCYKILSLYIIGGFSVTSKILEMSSKFGFSIYLLNTNFKLLALINNDLLGNTLIRSLQYDNNKNRDFFIAQQIIKLKTNNQINILKKIGLREQKIKEKIKFLELEITSIDKTTKINELMGIEGYIAKEYFKIIFSDNKWLRREPRVKRDIINLLLDIGYTILFNYIETILNLYGFDTFKGNLHQEFYKRKSLVCDLMEPFRPIIDYEIRKMYNLKQVDEKDFYIDNLAYNLKWEKGKKYYKCFVGAIINKQEEIFQFITDYYRWYAKNDLKNKFPEVTL